MAEAHSCRIRSTRTHSTRHTCRRSRRMTQHLGKCRGQGQVKVGVRMIALLVVLVLHVAPPHLRSTSVTCSRGRLWRERLCHVRIVGVWRLPVTTGGCLRRRRRAPIGLLRNPSGPPRLLLGCLRFGRAGHLLTVDVPAEREGLPRLGVFPGPVEVTLQVRVVAISAALVVLARAPRVTLGGAVGAGCDVLLVVLVLDVAPPQLRGVCHVSSGGGLVIVGRGPLARIDWPNPSTQGRSGGAHAQRRLQCPTRGVAR